LGAKRGFEIAALCGELRIFSELYLTFVKGPVAATEKAYSPDLLEDDRAIKDHILDLFWQKQDLLDRDGVKSLVFNTKAVAAELLLHFHQRKKTQSLFRSMQ
jgi:hypothetical protein